MAIHNIPTPKVLKKKKKVRKTITEEKCHTRFVLQFILMFVFIACFQYATLKFGQTENFKWVWLFAIGLFGIIFNTLFVFYNGFALGWELKRISIIEEE